MGGPWYTTWAFPGALQLKALSFPTAVYSEETSVWAAAAAAWHYLIINWFCVLAVGTGSRGMPTIINDEAARLRVPASKRHECRIQAETATACQPSMGIRREQGTDSRVALLGYA
jgi:hypothetical protein